MNHGEFRARVERMEARGYSRGEITAHMCAVMRRRYYTAEREGILQLFAPSGASIESFHGSEEAEAAREHKQAEADGETAELVERWLDYFCDWPASSPRGDGLRERLRVLVREAQSLYSGQEEPSAPLRELLALIGESR